MSSSKEEENYKVYPQGKKVHCLILDIFLLQLRLSLFADGKNLLQNLLKNQKIKIQSKCFKRSKLMKKYYLLRRNPIRNREMFVRVEAKGLC